MIREARDYFVDAVVGAVGTGILVSTAGDVTTKDALQTRVRVKLYPRETPDADITGDLKSMGGTVYCDVFTPIVKGPDFAEDVADDLVSSLNSHLGSHQLPSGQLNIWKVWSEAMREETTALHIPVVIRWTFLYN